MTRFLETNSLYWKLLVFGMELLILGHCALFRYLRRWFECCWRAASNWSNSMRSHFQTSQPLDSKNIGEETLEKYAIFSFRKEISKELQKTNDKISQFLPRASQKWLNQKNKSRLSYLLHSFLIPEFVGFQTMVILDPYGMTFDAVGVFVLAFHLLFRSWSTYCVYTACIRVIFP